MDARRSTRKLLAGLGLAAFLIGVAPQTAAALPSLPGTKQPFKLFARAISFINVNRVYMGVNSAGLVGVDSIGRGNVQGGFWPRGSADNYVFAAGMQVAGIVHGTKSPANPWGGDTAGGHFYDGNGAVQTEAVSIAVQAFNSGDAANWPAEAYVPQGDFVADLYAPPLQGLISASQGDVHFMAWDGNPALGTAASRKHPLGLLLDFRVMAWNYPAGAQDIVFLVLTVYNVTSKNCGDYAAHRAGVRDLLCAQGAKFITANNAKYSVNLPDGGYQMDQVFLGTGGDMDVGNEANNYDGGILPFAMGYTYDGAFFTGKTGWKFDPTIFGPPFFPGVGFVGLKYLKGPDGPGVISLISMYCFGNTGCNGHGDPATAEATFRQLKGDLIGSDAPCNITAPGKTAAQIHFCFILNTTTGGDTRILESAAPLTLLPGEGKTIAIAFVFAAPVQIPGFAPTSATTHPPGNPTWSNSTDSMFKYNASGAPGVTQIDSLTGFLAYTGVHFNTDGTTHEPTQQEFTVVKGSLLGKALVAQAVFDAKFLQEFAPDAPQFFLIPGDKQVTILWKPSNTEVVGDPFFNVVSTPLITSAGGGQVPNPLYDPNYRKFDVEGYRIYRGRSDSPNALKLLVQFDYGGTTFRDFTGAVFNGSCAPELGIGTDCPTTTPAGGFPTATLPTPAGLGPAVPPGTAYTRQRTYNIGPQTAAIGALAAGAPLMFVDQTTGTRVALIGGTSTLAQVVDTVVTGGGEGFPALNDAGVPFIFIDKAGAVGCNSCGVSNGIVYYYSVTAFDVNAPGHGPTSLESAKVTKQVVPQAPAANVSITTTTSAGTFGRASTVLTDAAMPTLDATTGKFSKKFPPSTALVTSLAGVPEKLLNGSGGAKVTFDSTTITTLASGATVGIIDWLTVGTSTVQLASAALAGNAVFTTTAPRVYAGSFSALALDSALSSFYGGGAGFTVGGTYTYTRPIVVVRGRGCANSWFGTVPTGKTAGQCYFFGPRWFNGDNETVSNPNVAAPVVQLLGTGAPATTGVAFQAPNNPVASFNNSGALTGVVTIHEPQAYGYLQGTAWRDFELLVAPFITASDYRVYWGAAGKIDSVIDLTYNTVVPFKTTISGSWGILNQAAATAANGYEPATALTAGDFACVAPATAFSVTGMPRCTVTPYVLSQTAVPGQIGYLAFETPITNPPTVPGTAAQAFLLNPPKLAANNGFGLYIKGRIFLFELTGGAVPAAGTQWTMRDYVGGVYGGNGTDPACLTGSLFLVTATTTCTFGSYAFAPNTPLPFTAPGASAQFAFNVANQTLTPTDALLAKVHTVPDPYYITSAYDLAVNNKDIQFVNVPPKATIRLYTSSGILIRVLQNTSTNGGAIVHWDVRNRTNQYVSSGVYFYSVESGTATYSGRMTIVNYANTVQ